MNSPEKDENMDVELVAEGDCIGEPHLGVSLKPTPILVEKYLSPLSPCGLIRT